MSKDSDSDPDVTRARLNLLLVAIAELRVIYPDDLKGYLHGWLS